jgi:hypothetical protein
MLLGFHHFMYGKKMEQKFSLCAFHVKGNHVQTSICLLNYMLKYMCYVMYQYIYGIHT